MEPGYIVIRGAQQHNLNHISLSIPRNKLVVLTGVSGSGKSSQAFDTIYAEGQRRTSRACRRLRGSFWDRWKSPKWITSRSQSGYRHPAKSGEQEPTFDRGTVTRGDGLSAGALCPHRRRPIVPQCGREVRAQSAHKSRIRSRPYRQAHVSRYCRRSATTQGYTHRPAGARATTGLSSRAH